MLSTGKIAIRWVSVKKTYMYYGIHWIVTYQPFQQLGPGVQSEKDWYTVLADYLEVIIIGSNNVGMCRPASHDHQEETIINVVSLCCRKLIFISL